MDSFIEIYILLLYKPKVLSLLVYYFYPFWYRLLGISSKNYHRVVKVLFRV